MATKAKPQNLPLNAILQRLDRIEDKLFGNGESLIERISKLEANQQQTLHRLEEYHAKRKEDLEQAILHYHRKTNELLLTQVEEQKRQNRMQFLGLWITLGSIALGTLIGFFTLAK